MMRIYKIFFVLVAVMMVSCGDGGSSSSNSNESGTVVGGDPANTATFDDATLDEAVLE